MKHYETLYITHPILESGRLKDTITNVQKLIETNETNKILCTEVWGKKKLAYPIEKQKYGTYVLVQYCGDGKSIKDVNIELEHNVNILAYLTVEIDETEIHKQENEIDDQISGFSSEDKNNKLNETPKAKEQEKQLDNNNLAEQEETTATEFEKSDEQSRDETTKEKIKADELQSEEN